MTYQDKTCKDQSHQSGFTLLEVLIAVVVLSLGLLGAAALQIKGLQSAHSAYQRTVASIIAADAAERLWLDMHDGAMTAATVTGIETAWINQWQTSDVTLPDLRGAIEPDGGLFTIRVSWAEGRFADADIRDEDGQLLTSRSEFVYHTRIFPPR
ncbi:MAG: type IV pilus modification protein PilV [Pirellulaceae bacterium]